MVQRASPRSRDTRTGEKRRVTEAAPTKLREGALEPNGSDPLRRHPMREPYAARSGTAPAASGTPETVTQRTNRNRRPAREKRG